MPTVVRCPNCKTAYTLAAPKPGARARCKACGTVFAAAGGTVAAAAPPSTSSSESGEADGDLYDFAPAPDARATPPKPPTVWRAHDETG